MLSLVVLWVCSCSVAAADSTKVDAKLEERWRSEYPQAAADWEATARSFLANGRMSFRWFEGSTTVAKVLKAAASGNKRLYIREGKTRERPGTPGKSEDAEVACETDSYAFVLSKAPGSGEFIIDDYVPYAKDDESRFNYWFNMIARNAACYLGKSLLQRMRDPSFVLKSIESVRDDENCTKITYEYEGKYQYESGAVILDVEKNWAIRSVEVACRNKSTFPPTAFKSNVEYMKVGGAGFFPRRVEFYVRTPKEAVYEHAVIEFDDVRLGPPPDEMFRLTAYGLPDVPLRPRRRASVFTLYNPWFWSTLAASIISFVLTWWLRPRGTTARPA